MDVAFVGGGFEGLRELDADPSDPVRRELLVGRLEFLERLSGDILHDEIEGVAGLAEVVDLGDAGMLEARLGFRFFHEALPALRVRVPGTNPLHGNFAVEMLLVTQEDLTHPARADLPLDLDLRIEVETGVRRYGLSRRRRRRSRCRCGAHTLRSPAEERRDLDGLRFLREASKIRRRGRRRGFLLGPWILFAHGVARSKASGKETLNRASRRS